MQLISNVGLKSLPEVTSSQYPYCKSHESLILCAKMKWLFQVLHFQMSTKNSKANNLFWCWLKLKWTRDSFLPSQRKKNQNAIDFCLCFWFSCLHKSVYLLLCLAFISIRPNIFLMCKCIGTKLPNMRWNIKNVCWKR